MFIGSVRSLCTKVIDIGTNAGTVLGRHFRQVYDRLYCNTNLGVKNRAKFGAGLLLNRGVRRHPVFGNFCTVSGALHARFAGHLPSTFQPNDFTYVSNGVPTHVAHTIRIEGRRASQRAGFVANWVGYNGLIAINWGNLRLLLANNFTRNPTRGTSGLHLRAGNTTAFACTVSRHFSGAHCERLVYRYRMT